MSFWPFGREPADIEMASRVITAVMPNGFKVRGKITIHFAEPQRQVDADEAADRCASVAVDLIRLATDHERVIGAEQQLCFQLLERYPDDIAPARTVEIAALHVVGDPALSDELRRASTIAPPAINTPLPPTGPVSSAASAPTSRPVATGSIPPPPGTKRRGSTQLRSIQSLLLPPGTPPSGIASFVAPTVRDSAARLLIGFLRAHDLITVRGVAIDETSAEMLALLVPASEAPPGGYEASRSAEISRWQAALGDSSLSAIRRETIAASVFMAWSAMLRLDVNKTVAVAVLESLSASAFPEEPALLEELSRFQDAMSPEFLQDFARDLAMLADSGDDPPALAAALMPLFSIIQEDMNYIALIIKNSSI